MKKKSRKKKGFAQRMIAWMLCCLCLLVAIPISALAFEANGSQITEENVIEKQLEDCTDEFETEAETEIKLGAETEDSMSKVAQDYLDKIAALKGSFETLDTTAEDYYTQLESLNMELGAIADAFSQDCEDGKLTEDEQNVIYAAMNDLNVLIGGTGEPEPQAITATVTNTLTNAEVAYVLWKSGDDVDSVTFNTVTSGVAVNANVNNGVLLFFVKPDEGCLITKFETADGVARDLYSIGISAQNSNIGYLKTASGAQDLLNRAKKLGYVGYYGFSYNGTSGSPKFTIIGEHPTMTVSAEVQPKENIKPGDNVTFTVTVTPSHEDKVKNIQVTSLTINGMEYTNYTNNGDGTYTVNYTVTENDWLNKSASLNVKAEIDYEYKLPLSDRYDVTSQIPTEVTVNGEDSTSCTFATKKSVIYKLNYDVPEDVIITTKPNAISQAPVDKDYYFVDDTVIVKDYDGTQVDDPDNGGTWTFDGWYENGGKYNSGDSLVMGEDGILLEGTWKFEKYPTITIRKIVSGNMGDKSKEFTFTVTGNTYEKATDADKSFRLKHQGVKTITAKVGDKITVTEDNGSYEASYKVTVPGAEDVSRTGNSVEYTVTSDAVQEITFTNQKEVTVDNGVLLDTLPYVLILAVVAVGAVLLLKKHKMRNED